MACESASGKAVLFDVDGTLLDTVPLIVESFQYVFNAYLGHPIDDEIIKASIGTPLETMFADYPPEQANSMKKDYLAYNNRHIQTHIAIFRQVPQLLENLIRRGIPMGLVTSKRRDSALLTLEVFDMINMFPVLVAKESTERHKPDPEPVFEAMRQLGVHDPSKVIFVGDSLHDLYCAQNAGCHSAIVDWTAMPVDELKAAGPDLWLKTPGQLFELLDRI